MIISLLITTLAIPAMFISIYRSSNKPYKDLTLSDMMLEDKLIASLMATSMISVGILQALFFIDISKKLNTDLFTILAIPILISFSITPIILLSGHYKLHEFTIKTYFLLAYLAQLLFLLKADTRIAFLALPIVIINILTTLYLYIKSPKSWKCEVNFSILMICFYLAVSIHYQISY